MVTSKYIITTRPEIKFSPVRTECISIINIPLTELQEDGFNGNVAEEIAKYKPEIIVLTSSFGALLFFKYYYKYVNSPKFIAIGNQTAEIIKKYEGNAEVPTAKDSYGVTNLLSKHSNATIALFRSNETNNIIDDYLSSNGIKFHEYHIYKVMKLETSKLKDLFFSDQCTGILITSSMEARIFHDAIGLSIDGKKIYSIGEITAKTLIDLGYNVFLTGKSDFENMIKEIDK
ncbi:uroporphyrinogen-III synthase [Ferroplasma sp.]|uniref:uroporphyrinogen-III synthase n=1 Tax=Ferroplasma sp. TaxID=2591003 RepID=UPI00307E126A